MKITWFAAMTFRIHIGGRIIVTHAEKAPDGIDLTELIAGAQTVVSGESPELAGFDPAVWRPRRRTRLIDTDPVDERPNLFRLGIRGLVADSADEGLLAIEDAARPAQWSRWADNAVVVLSGSGAQCAADGTALLDAARPRLIALAITDGDIDAAFDALAPGLDGASLIVLEPGLAVEV